MELRQLEYFSAVARDGTYTAAAERLHVAQPALWKQVHDLERELGVALFERAGRRVRITTAGTLLLERVDQLLGGANRLRLLADDLRVGRTGRVRVRCFAPHLARFLAGVITTFRVEHPGIGVELSEHGVAIDDRVSLVESLRVGAADVITTAHVDGDADLEGFRAYRVRVVALPAEGSRLAPRRTRLPVESLRDEALVVSPRGYFSRDRLDAACREAGFEPRIEAESSSPAALVALADHGLGTAIIADDAIGATRPPLALTADGAAIEDAVWLYRRARGVDPTVEAFVAVASRISRSLRI